MYSSLFTWIQTEINLKSMYSVSCCTWNQTGIKQSRMYSVSFIYSGSDTNKLKVNVFRILLYLKSNRVNVFECTFIYLGSNSISFIKNKQESILLMSESPLDSED